MAGSTIQRRLLIDRIVLPNHWLDPPPQHEPPLTAVVIPNPPPQTHITLRYIPTFSKDQKMPVPEGVLLGMGNPLLDISADVPQEVLDKCVFACFLRLNCMMDHGFRGRICTGGPVDVCHVCPV